MKSKLKIAIVLAALAACGCGVQGKPEGVDSVASAHALCNVTNGNTVIVCLDYAQDIPGNLDSCNNAEKTRYANRGADKVNYIGVGSTSVTTGCSLVNPIPIMGSCWLGGFDVRYYSTMWNDSSARADCLDRSGTYKPVGS